ncbi:hypothetical protein Bca52824_000271 [Brassica carinata]|uniref:CCHC-type domain-containing protein n=1 Tax=Brassica carinata TaxID=52824 RepID=A0A8X7WG67_BRACI|nr:hypothetical protein Bca52824_000271 [Brassica carinata]
MSSSSLSPVLRPAPVPPDLLFLHPSSDLETIFSPSSISPEKELQSLVSPHGAEIETPVDSSIPVTQAPVKPMDSWVSKIKSTFQPLVKVASPTVSSDGVPSIRAPDSITLVSSTIWKDHLVAYFHGRPPSPAKVFADLNPIWGKNGNISVKLHSTRSLLIYIPCPATRQWVLDVGLWHSGNCSFTAMLWHPSLNLTEMKLVHAPVWVLFKRIPFELWSTLGFSTMASAVGFPVHSEYPDLKPYSNGVVKLRVVIELDKPRPSCVRVTDKLGNSVSLPVEFLKLPPKCGGCGEYGHLRLRCPQPAHNKSTLDTANPPYMGVMTTPPATSVAEKSPLLQSEALSPLSEGSARVAPHTSFIGPVEKAFSSGSTSLAPRDAPPHQRKVERSKSLPLHYSPTSDQSLSSGWQYVAIRSKVNKNKVLSPPRKEDVSPVTSAKFAEEEELISAAQGILRNRLPNLENKPPDNSTSLSKKQERKKIRQNLYMLSRSSKGDRISSSSASVSNGGTVGFSLNGEERKSLVIDWIRLNRPLLGGFLETHVQHDNLQRNYSVDADNGRIVVAWDPLLSVVIYYTSPQLVVCGVFNPQTRQSFTAAFVYARNRREERLELWDKIKELAQANYNQVLSAAEVFSSTPYTLCQRGIQEFSDCLEESAIFDLAFRGCHLTWYNKSVTHPKARKIDRALVNEEWLDKYPDSYAFFDSPGTSDHTPCLISMANQLSPRKCRFIYFDMFSMHPDFQQKIRDAWMADIVSSSPMSSLYQRLRSAKACCKSLNRSSFSNIQARAKEAKQALDNVQSRVLTDPSAQLFQEEMEVRTSWMFYAAAEESFLHQKSRVKWLGVGDMNTGVFHKAVRANLSRNVIHYLLDSAGRKIFDSVTLKNMASQFYESLLGVLQTFYLGSGLGLNMSKTELFLDGFKIPETKALADRFDFTHGWLPVRYLGVPLMPHKLRPRDYQSLIDRSVCTPKFSGGLGLRRLEASNTVFGLKLIWLLFAATGSLWVAWIKEHVIVDRNFWTADFDNFGSWIRRRLMKLRPTARPFVVCRIQSGNEALFWHDNWTGLGPLISLSGANGPRVLGISSMATVSQTISNDSWALPRGRHRIIQLIKACLPTDPPVLTPLIPDVFLWRNNPDSEPGQFKAKRTWETLFPAPPLAIIQWLPSSSTNVKVRTICNLLVQAIVYVLWKERNARLHISSRRPFLLLVKEVTRLIKAKLIGLDRTAPLSISLRQQQDSFTSETYLHLWFQYFDA